MNGRRSVLARIAFAPLFIAVTACGSDSSHASRVDAAPPPVDAAMPEDPSDFIANLKDDTSCVLSCQPCNEATMPWQCPALVDWATLPHDPVACGAYDGTSLPAVTAGACSATAPSGDALAKATHNGVPVILPDGRRVEPSGTEWVFDEEDMPGGFPSLTLLIPGTPWLVVEDTGYDVQSVRVVDTRAMKAGPVTTPVVSVIPFLPPSSINFGMAYVAATGTLFVASGVPDSRVYAFDVDPTSGGLTEDAAKTLQLDTSVFPQAIAVSADGKTLLVGPAGLVGDATTPLAVLVYSLDTTNYGKQIGTIGLGSTDVFSLGFDPSDPTGNTAYATMWHSDAVSGDSTKMVLAELDVAAQKAKIIPVGKEPEGFVFLNARYMVVANGYSDTLSIVDRPAGTVAAEVPLLTNAAAEHGVEPTILAYDATNARLYATLAAANGVEVFSVDATQTPPAVTPIGSFSTAWWPTGLSVDTDGTVYVTNGKGHGSDLKTDQHSDSGDLMHGSMQAVPFMDAPTLAAATTKQQALTDVQAMTGYSTVQCNGAPYDFPLPEKISDGPSTKIKHVVFVVRENKTFDAIFGDVPGLDGDPSLVMSPGMQDEIWPNARNLAATFSHMDNFYEDAEQSIQGHFWTVYGRTSDLDERKWLVIWGRGEFSETQQPGLFDDTSPLEGSLFTDFGTQGVSVENMGELLDGFRFGPYVDHQWPGGSNETTIPDSPPACYVAARARVTCDLPDFTYIWIANDHTFGLGAGYPNPAVMIAENDEATGILLDGLSHSPIWQDTLFVVVEDDPQDGADHVDQHRTIALFASPWVKRNYVSHAHYDLASVHKIFAHVFGKAYPNEVVANAPLPLDIFTSTPDYTPYDYIPRRYTDISCNPKTGAPARKAARWDFSEPDNQPGLSAQVEEYMRDVAARRAAAPMH